VQNSIKLSAAVYELSCSQSFDDAENISAVAPAGSKNSYMNMTSANDIPATNLT